MLNTNNKIYYSDARNLEQIPSNYVDLIVTSPPYPMIQMWDEIFNNLNNEISEKINSGNGSAAFELIHIELDKVWDESFRVLKDGGIACINIGDATRTINNNFQLFSNHSRIINHCLKIGFSALPMILWRKQTNAPNKFMGSGMLPVGAYVTLEHEYIIILRKGKKREFKSKEEKLNRQKSSFFWEERNIWFSDIWDFKGRKQNLNNKELRQRSAAFPFELVYRLINMYSVKGDVVFDPFLGTGTSLYAAITSNRNFIGIEIDNSFKYLIESELLQTKDFSNLFITERLKNHINFALNYEKNKKPMKYVNKNYGFPVMTNPESEIILNHISNIELSDNNITVNYNDNPVIDFYDNENIKYKLAL